MIKTSMVCPPTTDLAIMNLCDAAAKIMVFSDKNTTDKLAAMHSFVIDEWDSRMAGTMAKILELLMENKG